MKFTIYIHSETLHSLSPPLSKSGGGGAQAPPAPPGSLLLRMVHIPYIHGSVLYSTVVFLALLLRIVG